MNDSAVLAWCLAQPVGQRARDLADAYANGASSVVHDGVRVEYRSAADMMLIMRALYAAGTGAPSRPACTYAAFNRGW